MDLEQPNYQEYKFNLLAKLPIVSRDSMSQLPHARKLISDYGVTGYMGAMEIARLTGIRSADPSREHIESDNLNHAVLNAILEVSDEEIQIVVQDSSSLLGTALSSFHEVISTQPKISEQRDLQWETQLLRVLQARQDIEHILTSLNRWNVYNLKDSTTFEELTNLLDELDRLGEETIMGITEKLEPCPDYEEDEELCDIQYQLSIPEGPEKWWRQPFTSAKGYIRNQAGRRFPTLRLSSEEAERKREILEQVNAEIRAAELRERLKRLELT